eukprot:Plantae.Rhodophyta-Hildenbrandia_rubra.ctg24694.p1 GENE.Plantae.Rhodophyta-Hildenbrandia_rubra.ctg24694~~Plantae.Rhodophyta-Hildenbrandia_rubra.ctg24694.p1  ORF type:complete len:586 (-),score=109.23 Plantae.Rhodophyta-Hildenbrandia_rubra.ctg24694:641-2398(-)
MTKNKVQSVTSKSATTGFTELTFTMSKRKMTRVTSRDVLCERLTKRARLAAMVSTPTSTESSGLVIDDSYRWYTTDECRELLDILLLKAGFDLEQGETDGKFPLEMKVIEALRKEYSPRAAELLVKMVTGGGDLTDVISDISSDVDGDEDIAQTVPMPTPKRDPELPSITLSTKIDSKDSKVQYNQKTEIALSRIFELGKAASVVDTSILPTAPYFGPRVITMTGFGKLGRFGNQVLQYMFLKCYAKVNIVEEIQVPSWIGSSLFGLDDREVQRALPAATEFKETKANSTFTTEFIDYIEASNGGKLVPEIGLDALSEEAQSMDFVNVDVWGWFQWHTSKYAPFKSMIQSTFEPVKSLKSSMDKLFEEKVKYYEGKRRTVVGIHIRRGDYKNIAASSFGYCAPTSWYLEWLENIWDSLDNPVLMITSDEVNAVIGDFAKYNPITAENVGFDLPSEFKGRKAGFFPDWYGLTMCDVLGISNSTFSFTACMMNKVGNARFYRPHYLERMTEFNPWNADPIIHRPMKKNSIAQTLETLQVVYATQGSGGLLRNMLYELPVHAVRSLIIKGVLWRKARVRQKQLLVPTA